MGQLRIFVLPSDEACADALKFLRKLCADVRYRGVKTEIIDEKKRSAFSDGYDYIFVPAFFVSESVCGKDGRRVTRWAKVHEGKAFEDDVRAALEVALKDGVQD